MEEIELGRWNSNWHSLHRELRADERTCSAYRLVYPLFLPWSSCNTCTSSRIFPCISCRSVGTHVLPTESCEEVIKVQRDHQSGTLTHDDAEDEDKALKTELKSDNMASIGAFRKTPVRPHFCHLRPQKKMKEPGTSDESISCRKPQEQSEQEKTKELSRQV